MDNQSPASSSSENETSSSYSQESSHQSSQESSHQNSHQKYRTANLFFYIGLILSIVGIIAVVNAGENHPMVMIFGIFSTAIGVFTAVIAKFYVWWKNS